MTVRTRGRAYDLEKVTMSLEQRIPFLRLFSSLDNPKFKKSVIFFAASNTIYMLSNLLQLQIYGGIWK